MLPDVTINKVKGGLGRRQPGEDYITGMIVFGTKPSSWANAYKQLFGIDEAEQNGIVGDYSDETKATGGNVLITTAGAAGATHTIKMDGVTLAAYTVKTNDTASDIATELRLLVNYGTAEHGYAAAGSTANVALTAPAGKGDTINGGTHLAFTGTGTAAATVTQFTTGVTSKMKKVHYHTDLFFKKIRMVNCG